MTLDEALVAANEAVHHAIVSNPVASTLEEMIRDVFGSVLELVAEACRVEEMHWQRDQTKKVDRNAARERLKQYAATKPRTRDDAIYGPNSEHSFYMDLVRATQMGVMTANEVRDAQSFYAHQFRSSEVMEKL